MVMRYGAALAVLVLILGGCASLRTSATGDGNAGYAAPGPDFTGTWTGRAWVQSASINEFTSVPIDLTINPDGTWSWSRLGQLQGRGTAAVHGDRIVLTETFANKGTLEQLHFTADRVELRRSGDQLWGVSRMFMPNAPTAVELKKKTAS
jgi:hypothetical protein